MTTQERLKQAEQSLLEVARRPMKYRPKLVELLLREVQAEMAQREAGVS